MMNKFVIGIILCIISLSCDDENPPENTFCERYEEGTLLVGIAEGMEIEQSFDLFNDLGFRVDQVSGNYYQSSLPGDSIDYVIEYLNSKNYINSNGFSAVEGGSVYLHYQTQILTVLCSLWDMTLENQQDWIEAKSILKLTDKSDKRSFVLTVPVGKEMKWATTFKTFENVRYAELNCYLELELGS